MQLYIGRNGTRWSQEHDRLLIDRAAEGATKEDIAAEVGRTPLGVYERAKALEVRFLRHLGWTKEEDAILRAGIAAGKSRKQTATGLPNRSLDSLSMRAARLGLGFTVGSRNDIWDVEDRLERTLTMWASGMSGKEIAKVLDCELTRSAIIAKMHRRGMRRARVYTSRPKKVRVARKPRVPRPMKAPKPFVLKDYRVLRNFKAPDGWLPPTPANDIARIPLDGLQSKHCRWIVGDPKRTPRTAPLYCGHDRQPGLAYCAAHSVRAFHRVSEAPRQFFPGDDNLKECV